MEITDFFENSLRQRVKDHRNRALWQVLFLVFIVFLAPGLGAQGKTIFFHEDFSSLDNWKPFTFPKIQKYTLYSIEQDRDRHILKAESKASASAIVYKDSFNAYEYSRA